MALTEQQLLIIDNSVGKYIEREDVFSHKLSAPGAEYRGFITRAIQLPGDIRELWYTTEGCCTIQIGFNINQAVGEFDEDRVTLTVSHLESIVVKSFRIYFTY